jgi:hypothetical protein
LFRVASGASVNPAFVHHVIKHDLALTEGRQLPAPV